MLRGLRVPMLPATTRPPRRRLLSAAAALFHQGVDIVLYGYLAVAWAHSLGGVAVEILGRWVYGKGSAAESVGAAVRAASGIVLVRLYLAVAPLFVMRVIERAKFDEERREKWTPSSAMALRLAPWAGSLFRARVCLQKQKSAGNRSLHSTHATLAPYTNHSAAAPLPLALRATDAPTG
ncbi:hypothetical protein U9M48_038978 [Paspalum notatum var. saurae]|uniref:Uncharacterized protein n=1 Tax=Paspalum notatum var. saurae TaxID=547442 RepID=A0AAQ3UKE3_PASNO